MCHFALPIKFFRRTTIALFCYMLAVGVSQADVTLVEGDGLQSLLDQGMPIIDVRRPDEWQSSGVVESSYLLTFFDKRGNYDVEKWIADLHEIVAVSYTHLTLPTIYPV